MKRLILVISIFASIPLAASCQGKSRQPAVAGAVIPREMNADTFRTYVEKARSDAGYKVLDVRTPEEFAQGHIAGAANLDFYAADFRAVVAALPRADVYLVYCRSGNRSGQTLDIMKTLGFPSFAHLAGGIGTWSARGYPLEK